MWWNVTGLVAAAAVTAVVSRLLAPPSPSQLARTTVGAAAPRRAWSADRGLYIGLLGYGAAMAAVALALGAR